MSRPPHGGTPHVAPGIAPSTERGARPHDGPGAAPVTGACAAAVVAAVALMVSSLRPGTTVPVMALVVVGTLAAIALSDGRGARGVWAVAGLLALHLSVPVSRVPTERGTVALLLVGGTAVVAAAALLADHHRRLPVGTVACLLLFGHLTAVTLLLQPEGLVPLALAATAGVAGYLLVGTADGTARRAMAVVLVALAVLQALVAVVEPWLLPDPLWGPAQLGAGGQPVQLANGLTGLPERSQGAMGHPLPLGLLLVVALALSDRLLRSPWLLLPLQGLLLLGIVFAGARSSLVLAVVVLLLLPRRGLTAPRLVLAMLALLSGALLVVAAVRDVGSRIAEVAASGSWQHRVGALGAVERLALWQPVDRVLAGNGYGSSSRLVSEGLLQDDGFAAVDNQLVLLLAQGGVVAVLLLCGIATLCLLRAGPGTRPALLCALATMLVFDVLLWPAATFLLFLTLGLAATDHRTAWAAVGGTAAT